MEMNRRIIAALYIMAGYAVAVPLEAQTKPESLKAECFRPTITSTIKIIEEYIEEASVQDVCGQFSDSISFQKCNAISNISFPNRDYRVFGQTLCCTSRKIRAPGMTGEVK